MPRYTIEYVMRTFSVTLCTPEKCSDPKLTRVRSHFGYHGNPFGGRIHQCLLGHTSKFTVHGPRPMCHSPAKSMYWCSRHCRATGVGRPLLALVIPFLWQRGPNMPSLKIRFMLWKRSPLLVYSMTKWHALDEIFKWKHLNYNIWPLCENSHAFAFDRRV